MLRASLLRVTRTRAYLRNHTTVGTESDPVNESKQLDSTSDYVSSPNSVSQIRLLQLPERLNDNSAMIEYRQLRVNIATWLDDAWRHNNSMYNQQLARFEEQVMKEKGYVVAADRALFYQSFLDASYTRQSEFYRAWIRQLIRVIAAGYRANINKYLNLR